MDTDTPQNRVFAHGAAPRVLRRGDAVEEVVPLALAARTVSIATPCCQVRYRVAREDAAHYERTGNTLQVRCGKNLNGRGNRAGADGCHWPFAVAFLAEGQGFRVRWRA